MFNVNSGENDGTISCWKTLPSKFYSNYKNHSLDSPDSPSFLGLYCNNIFAATLDRSPSGFSGKRKFYSGRPAGEIPMGTWHIYCGVKKIFLTWSYSRESAYTVVLQWDCLICFAVSLACLLMHQFCTRVCKQMLSPVRWSYSWRTDGLVGNVWLN